MVLLIYLQPIKSSTRRKYFILMDLNQANITLMAYLVCVNTELKVLLDFKTAGVEC